MAERALFPELTQKLWTFLDRFATEIINVEKAQQIEKHKKHAGEPVRTRLLSPESDVRQLMTSATDLEDIWNFFLKRLRNGSEPDFLCFSVIDESGDFIRVRFLHPLNPNIDFDQPIISMAERQNHLVQAYARKDTTFANSLIHMGDILEPYLRHPVGESYNLNLFSIPFIAKNQAIAMITLGFQDIDAFSQAKLSYVYTLRDQIAQLVWNLVLQDRMQSQAQVDNLTGLLSYTYFQHVLDAELAKSEENGTSLTAMILDINNIQEVNARLGHTAGDEAICHLASTVRRSIRGLDTVARHGGDEVVVILPEIEPDEARQIAERFIKSFKDRLPAKLKGLSISIGHATYPDDSKKRDMLLKLAEQALHLAKFKGVKTGESNIIASHEVDQLNEKTILEVFASHVARKYDTQNPSVFQDLMQLIENKTIEESLSPDHLMLETIGSLAGALDAKDKYTRGHSQAVANYAVALAHALQLKAEEVEHVRLAAFLHDIGKIGIPESILCKNGPLNEKEWEVMKQHPVIGAEQILSPVSSLKPIIPMVRYHHENWDGTGYPEGIAGDKIPLGARIVSIVDAFHGLTSDRSYRKALPILDARKIMEAGSGSKWDPSVLEIFFKILTMAAPKAHEKPAPVSPQEIAPPAETAVVEGQPAVYLTEPTTQTPDVEKPAAEKSEQKVIQLNLHR